MSLRRQNRWMLRNISATTLFLGGMVALPAYLFQESLVLRAVQVALFGVLTVLAGKRLLWLYFGTILLGITFFHLLVPTGAVLAEPFGFPVTAGALRNGVFKGLTIIGMVFVSLVSVRADLRIPGSIGALAGKLFWSFEQIMERREELDLSAPFRSADTLLLELYGALATMDDSVADTQRRKETAPRSSWPGTAVVILVVSLQWGALFVPLP